MEKVIVYSKYNCMQCKMTKRYLDEHNVAFEERNVNDHPEYLDHLKNQGFQSLPVIESVDLPPFSGFRPAELAKLAG
ncbi:glutaredoxin-like protein NrdH [Levilactobacillus bambusae]|uniref:Glutaredoxin-like protein NrdH n=1 Tax=Levilactobacillus bambusae TaxID=2024736 RepID=A0A2V1MZ12_9LACO|nr:glutaredoxin-like protein NrdH [Levilactobacillus bambusae]PWF99385.1 NrdH-redoxin [Levilactobacillus bambusae]